MYENSTNNLQNLDARTLQFLGQNVHIAPMFWFLHSSFSVAAAATHEQMW